MNIKLEEYFNKVNLEKQHTVAQEKERILLELELYDKVYSPNGEYSDEYSNAEYDDKAKATRYYKAVPIQISDDDYTKLKRIINERESEANFNVVARALSIIAWSTYVIGFFAGIIQIEDGFPFMLLFWVGAFISGTLVLGLSEIIKLLHSLNKKIAKFQ